MDKHGYKLAPFRCASDFVKDVAALTREHANLMKRKVKSKTTVLGSLNFATGREELQYLFNGPRYMARNPSSKMMYGTTSCEAVHGELARFFSSTHQQTARYACGLTKLFCIKKLITGFLQRLELSRQHDAHELLQSCTSIVARFKFDWGGDVAEMAATPHQVVDTSSLPANAKLSAVHVGKRRRCA